MCDKQHVYQPHDIGFILTAWNLMQVTHTRATCWPNIVSTLAIHTYIPSHIHKHTHT